MWVTKSVAKGAAISGGVASKEAEVIVGELEERCEVAEQVTEQIRELGKEDAWKEAKELLAERMVWEVDNRRPGW